MEASTMIHMKIGKQIFCYIKGTFDYGLYFSPFNNFKHVGYSGSDWGRDMRKFIYIVLPYVR